MEYIIKKATYKKKHAGAKQVKANKEAMAGAEAPAYGIARMKANEETHDVDNATDFTFSAGPYLLQTGRPGKVSKTINVDP